MKGITIHDPLSGGKIMNESKWGHSSSTHRALGTVRRIIPSEAPYPCKSTVLDTTLPIRERCTLPSRHLRARRALEHDAVPIAHTQKVGLRLLQHHHDPYDVSGHKVLQQPSQQRYQRVHWGHWELAGRVATNGSEPSCRSRGLESPGSAHPPIRGHSLTSTSTQKSIDVRQDKMALAHGVSRTHSLPGALVKRRSSRSYHPGISTVYARHKEQEVGPCVETKSILKALERRCAQLSNQNQESSFSITSSASRSEVPYAYGQIRQEKVSVKRNIAKQLKSSSITFPKMSELLTHSKSTTKEVVSTNQQSSPYVLLMMSRAGTTFEAFRDALLSRSHDNNSCVNDWRESSFNATRTLAHARGRPPPRTNMLLLQNELKKIHIFLGEKLSTESLLEDILCPHVGVKYIVLDSGTCTQSRLITNYFVGTRQITLKDRLTMTLRKWNLEWMMPETYIITPRGFDNDDRFLLRDIMLSNNKVKPDVFWIVKSAHGSKGEGQRIFYSYSELVHYIDRQTFPNSWVAQRYISRPFLIHGRKFDIRVWVLVTCQGEYYVYEQGVLRTSSEYYSLSDLDNVLVHLTNHCIQERGPKYSMYEKGNEMSYEMFQQYLDQHHRIKTGVAFDFERDAMPLIRKIIYEVLKCMDQCFHAAPIPSSASMNRAQENKIHYVPYNKANVLPFQLFGFDFMLDYDFNVFLLEVNGSPAIADHLRDQMVEEMVAICVDPIFPPSTVRERVNFSFQRIEPQDKKT